MADPDPVEPPSTTQFHGPPRESGSNMGRILSLSDGVFAFAMTLLVLSLALPARPPGPTLPPDVLAGALNMQFYSLLAYVIAFLVIGLWWSNHHDIFRSVRRYDRGLIWLNLFFLMLIALTPFALGLFVRFQDNSTSAGWFAGLEAITGGLMAALCVYTLRSPDFTETSAEKERLRFLALRGALISAVFAASIGVAFVYAPATIYIWAAIIPLGYVIRWRQAGRHRPRASVPPTAPAPAAPGEGR